MKIRLNSDERLVAEIMYQLDQNDGYCPCKIIKSDETKCMCKEFEESTELGLCHCGFFEKIEL